MSDKRIREIPRQAWTEELNRFTLAHEGWLVSVAVLGADIGAQAGIRNLPLIGISADRIDADGTIAISVAHSAEEHFTHVIRGARRVYVERAYNGATASLLVQSDEGTSTILRVTSAAVPRHASQ